MDRLDAMSILLTVVESGSLSAAARRLGTPLATVSRKVADLEAHLNAQLLIRSTRRLALTDAGEAYVAACRRILDDVGEAERAASGEYRAPRGDLTITAPIVFGRMRVLPVVMDFLKAYPDIAVRLTLSDRVLNLLDNEVDLALRIGEAADGALAVTRLGTIRRVVCASPAYLAARGMPATPRDLEGHDCVAFEGLVSPRAWSFGAGKAARTVRVRSRLVVNTAEAAVDAAIAGIGVTRVLSYQVAPAVAAGALRIVLADFEPAPWPVSLVHPGQGRVPLKLRAFLDFAQPRLTARLDAI